MWVFTWIDLWENISIEVTKSTIITNEGWFFWSVRKTSVIKAIIYHWFKDALMKDALWKECEPYSSCFKTSCSLRTITNSNSTSSPPLPAKPFHCPPQKLFLSPLSVMTFSTYFPSHPYHCTIIWLNAYLIKVVFLLESLWKRASKDLLEVVSRLLHDLIMIRRCCWWWWMWWGGGRAAHSLGTQA